MSHTVDIAHTHNTHGLVTFPIAFGPGVRYVGAHSLAHPPIKYGSVGEEKEPGYEILPDLDPRSSDA
jgi:hypothetical protein